MLSTVLVWEEKASYTDHDRLFKQLIQTFFQDFVAAFFPDEYELIDFSDVRFLEQEIITDIFKGEKRRVDLLAEVNLKGEKTMIIIHIEPQSYYQKEFHERMYIYFSSLYIKYRRPILPISVFSYNNSREVASQFTVEMPTLKILEFNYLQIHLITMDWRSYIYKDSPVIAALLSKMGYKQEERIQVKMEFLRMLSRMELNPAKMDLIYGFFETYLKLNAEEEEKMREEITHLPKEEAKQVLRLPNSYFEKGIEKGMEKGIEKGVIEAQRKIAKRLLSEQTPIEVVARVTELPLKEVEMFQKEME